MFDLVALIKAAGYLGLFGIIFAESGLFIGFFLPGDSLLFTAGFLASQGFLDIYLLVPLLFVAAVLGDSVGYTFGHRLGPRIFTKQDSLLFHEKHLMRSKLFFEKHGGKTIILARFLPVVRTFAPILAGVGKMKYAEFLSYNIIGALLWAVGVTVSGYYLGNTIPGIDQYLIPIILGIIIITSSPTLIHIWRDKPLRNKLINFLLRRREF
jgi:membrane-associated protein